MGEMAQSGQFDEKVLHKMKSMIQSMTLAERKDPALINAVGSAALLEARVG